MTYIMRPPALLFGVPIDDLTMSDALDAIGHLVDLGRAHNRSHQIATVNVDFLVNALRDSSMREMLQQADLNLNDGMPVVWGARALAMQQRERVAGSDLVPALAERAAQKGWRLHFFGSAPGVGDRAAQVLRSRHPGLTVSAEAGPTISDVEAVDDAVLDQIAAVEADVLCVALGNPKQERFIAAHRERLGTPVMIGIGGSLEMLVGDLKRAPVWARKAGAEWLFRAAQEPGRLGRRYARDAFVFGPAFGSHARKVRRTLGGPGLGVSVADSVSLTGAPTVASDSAWQSAAMAIADGRPLAVDLAGLDMLDVRAVAQLAGLVRLAKTARGKWSIYNRSFALSEYVVATQSEYWVQDSAT